MADSEVAYIVVCDDYPLARAGVCSAITAEPDLEVAGVAADGRAAAELVRRLQPQVALLGYRLPGLPLTEVVAQLTRESRLCALVYGGEENLAAAQALVTCGACGYLLREDTPDCLIRAIRAALSGDCWLSSRLLGTVGPSRQESVGADDGLTPREREVLALLASGRTNADIAAALCLAPQTVRNYVSVLYGKLGVASRAEAIVWGRERRYHRNSGATEH
ncbi:MAG: response regulator transcription factor [Chloroflexi bacterium]|nr:response regulator transcription factor [Chloroflexota bacterium]